MEKISIAVRFRSTAPTSSDDSCTSGGDREWRIDDTHISLLHRAAPVPSASFAYKAAKLRDLQAQVLHNHHSHTYTKEALGLSFKLLGINPEVYTAWNYRKIAFQHNLGELSDPEAIKSVVDDVLRVVEIALRQNPKSYGAWYHQKWLLNQKLAPVDFKREFGLLDKLLMVDARNFPGWNYRRWLLLLLHFLLRHYYLPELGYVSQLPTPRRILLKDWRETTDTYTIAASPSFGYLGPSTSKNSFF